MVIAPAQSALYYHTDLFIDRIYVQSLLAHPQSWMTLKKLNYCWRVFGTGLSFIVFGCVALLLSIVFGLIVRVLPISDERRQVWVLNTIRYTVKIYLLQLEFIGLIKVSKSGAQLSGLKGHMVIANHPSLIDALFILARLDNACCIVKEPLWRNPVTRFLVKLAGFIPNDSYELLDGASKALQSGKNLIIFPEGTRNVCDQQLLFKRGAANIALAAQCPITPVVLEIYPRSLQKGDKWFHIPKQRVSVSMTVHKPLDWQQFVDENKPITLQARTLTSGLREFYVQRVTEFRNNTDC